MSENKQQNALKEKQADVRMETKVCKETPSQNLNFEGIHKEDLKRLQNFRLLDDDFMTKVFEDEKCAEFLSVKGDRYHVRGSINASSH